MYLATMAVLRSILTSKGRKVPMSPNAPLISGNVKEELKDAKCPCTLFKACLACDPSIASQLCAADVCRAAARCSLQQLLEHLLLFSQ